jgi:hypothetical protein
VARSWTVLALRPQPTSDADLKLYDAPDYLTQLSRSTASVGVVDLIVANYANAPEDTGAVLMGSPGPLGVYLLDWFEHPIAMASGDYVALDLGDRIGTGFTANLMAGSQYRFHFDPDNGTTGDISLMLFGPRAAVPNFKYGTRADSIAGSDVWAAKPAGWNANEGIEQFNFSPTITGQYFLYAYQKTGAPVSGVLRFSRRRSSMRPRDRRPARGSRSPRPGRRRRAGSRSACAATSPRPHAPTSTSST